jgi:hypothetical protein
MNTIPKVKKGKYWRYDLRGLRFGFLVAQKEATTKDKDGRIKWQCLCDCNKKTYVLTAQLINGHTESCGCQGANNLKGKKFGRLTAINPSKLKTNGGNGMWNCLCDCGNKVRVRTASLKNGNTKSCGCLKINNLRGKNNYQARRMIDECGTWIPTTDPWSMRATRILSYSRREGIPIGFSSVGEFATYLKSIAPSKCPVFGKRLTTGNGQSHDWSPSVDKIIPSKGYVRGNIQIMSYMANKMKQDATPSQLKQFAQWVIKENDSAKQSTTSN